MIITGTAVDLGHGQFSPPAGSLHAERVVAGRRLVDAFGS
jgi:hypothetical protein